MTDTFSRRMHLVMPHEQQVIERLTDAGWYATKWGQELLHEDVRRALRNARPISYARWMPDILATRDGELRWIDAKATGSENRDTGNYSLEKDAHTANLLWSQWFGIVYYVWGDFMVSRAPDLEPAVTGRPLPMRTEYWLINKQAHAHSVPFGSVFA